MPVTNQDLIEMNHSASGNKAEIEAAGFTLEYLLTLAKDEVKANVRQSKKLKGAVNPADLPDDKRVVATSGVIQRGQDGQQIFGDGETLIEWEDADWPIRQRARMDIHKLRQDYPPEQKQIDMSGNMSHAVRNLSDEDLEAALAGLADESE